MQESVVGGGHSTLGSCSLTKALQWAHVRRSGMNGEQRTDVEPSLVLLLQSSEVLLDHERDPHLCTWMHADDSTSGRPELCAMNMNM